MNTILCISSYYKGADFMIKAKQMGQFVILITSDSLRNENWPWDSIDEVFYMEEIQPYKWNLDHLILGIANYIRTRDIDIVVALDDFDVEKAAKIRETFRISGMGQTTYRHFRDKLAMRQKAKSCSMRVPEFTSVFNNDKVNKFVESVAAPWVLKPRSEASAVGIKKIHDKDELWNQLHSTHDERHLYLLEQFRPGHVYHVDSLIFDGKVIFSCASQYVNTPMDVAHGGGVFMTATMETDDAFTKELVQFNDHLLIQFGLKHGATHSEFIRDHATGEIYFLETACRVGGAYIPNMVEKATGINLWHEWANIEIASLEKRPYKLPTVEKYYAGLLVALSKDEYPDLSFVNDPEFVGQIEKKYHVGMLFKSSDQNAIQHVLQKSSKMVAERFLNIIPPQSHASG